MTGARVFIKLCGFVHEDDVRAARELDIDAVGFVVASDARVPLPLEEAARLATLLAGTGIQSVAVLGRATLAECERAMALGFDVLQVVDDGALPEGVLGRPLLPVFFDADDVVLRAHQRAHELALDGSSLGRCLCLDGQRGQGGAPPSLERAKLLAERVPLLFAGGLDPTNVRGVIQAVRPRAVDVSSGISTSPERKDPALMAAFVAQVRGA